MTRTDAAIFAELRPFIVARMKAGESFEAALSKAADDALAYCRQNADRILDDVHAAANA